MEGYGKQTHFLEDIYEDSESIICQGDQSSYLISYFNNTTTTTTTKI